MTKVIDFYTGRVISDPVMAQDYYHKLNKLPHSKPVRPARSTSEIWDEIRPLGMMTYSEDAKRSALFAELREVAEQLFQPIIIK